MSSVQWLVRWLRRNEAGQDLIEFALSALLLITLAAGIVDFGSAFQQYIIVTNASREGARLAARAPCLPADATQRGVYRSRIVDAVLAEAAVGNVTLLAGNVTVTPDPVGTGCPTAGNPIVVQVSHPYNALFSGLLGLGALNLSARTEMVFFGNDRVSMGVNLPDGARQALWCEEVS